MDATYIVEAIAIGYPPDWKQPVAVVEVGRLDNPPEPMFEECSRRR